MSPDAFGPYAWVAVSINVIVTLVLFLMLVTASLALVASIRERVLETQKQASHAAPTE